MSQERRYTVTEGQLIDPYNSAPHKEFRKWIATLTPDPVENGAEVVERIDQLLHEKLGLRMDSDGFTIRVRGHREASEAITSILTAEVTRQVEERTKWYREALENISREFGSNPSFGDDILGRVLSRICTTTRQALANKGGSDESR